MCSPRVFPIAPHFNHICFAESPPLLTYRKAGHSIFPLKLLYRGSLHSFNFFFLLWANQIGSLQKKKSWPCDTPQLINMEQNKYPQLSRYYVPKFLPLPLTQAKTWWQTVLQIEISCSQWEVPACTHDGPWFFLFGGGVGRVFFFLDLYCSQCVLNMFSSCSFEVP
jgi:hypothetical protein